MKSPNINMIMEGIWSDMNPAKPARKDGMDRPVETTYGSSLKTNKIGYPELNLYNTSLASGNNPYEQEEEVIKGTIEIGSILEIIENEIKNLDSSNNNDRICLSILSSIKEKIINLKKI